MITLSIDDRAKVDTVRRVILQAIPTNVDIDHINIALAECIQIVTANWLLNQDEVSKPLPIDDSFVDIPF